MKTVLLSQLKTDEVVKVLKANGLVVYPTETVYGLGVDATSEMALEKLWKFKGERGNKPVLVAVSGVAMAEEYVILSDLGKKVVQKYWPGAVAIVATSKNKVSKKAQGETNTLGLRNPDSKDILEIIDIFGKPITSTSANVSGAMTAKSLKEFLETVPKEKQKLIDLFIDAGELLLRQPSTIVDTTGKEIKILRQGSIVVEV
ncbi:TPA: threonylcarbamoyl-AMP synthase [Candidatus Collierbacteria bacterium]|uniref:L-threonylcarbamoyladenylate synthase n=1 Tax=Candidatus Collierbacteria bacterium GW2011_GWA2_42_17 TaxID=1618378 RepID=A0A0G1C0Q8_9BACT|nr:MAG: Sua5/YciO/YrdC/YwlC family protein [Candidatus Collierbacteria bacterium GW2011_GWA2_42_17]KKS62023.1 MAG: Sua5/YciO/YrdC/YwlC family protein [Candidatus Collierbacteria bacterium GW2011_GWD2_42_50]KKS62359.1 MAG: Sua5/YciO/YrdC/YwlC family protein [Candidatus Collierbacteria bacterium GW2011_GWF1_42_50]KKS62375.1 MAG: Sua5/YciO/YrdC/YwlC family protein [Candidatus Collierbacteria bacterium GW2011_GWE2_42_48]KKS64289.1 MAG: Sua5/YciO/YrdC/YwlC family protein [Candidatus Collierbacteria 